MPLRNKNSNSLPPVNTAFLLVSGSSHRSHVLHCKAVLKSEKPKQQTPNLMQVVNTQEKKETKTKSKQIKGKHETTFSRLVKQCTEVRSSPGNRVLSTSYGEALFVRNFLAPYNRLHWLEVKLRCLQKMCE